MKRDALIGNDKFSICFNDCDEYGSFEMVIWLVIRIVMKRKIVEQSSPTLIDKIAILANCILVMLGIIKKQNKRNKILAISSMICEKEEEIKCCFPIK